MIVVFEYLMAEAAASVAAFLSVPEFGTLFRVPRLRLSPLLGTPLRSDLSVLPSLEFSDLFLWSEVPLIGTKYSQSMDF